MAPRPSITYRWTGKDALNAQAAPVPDKAPPLVTPYGIIPGELSGAKGFTDGGSVPLTLSLCRVPWMVDRFYKSGYAWEKVPDGVTGATIGELCASLLGSNKDRYALYDFKGKSDDWKNALALTLFDYWENTDYRWAVTKRGDFSWTLLKDKGLSLPTEGKDGDKTARLTMVLALLPVKKPIAAPPNASKDAAKKSVTVSVEKKPDPAADPDPGSPFAKLDEALRETLKKSFLDRIGNMADADKNLDNAFWGGPPATTWEALDRFRPMCVNLIVRLFDRIKAIDPSLKLWKEIKYLKNFWYGGSAGAKIVYKDPKSVRVTLDALFKNTNGGEMARDKYIGGLEHQKKSSIELVGGALDPNAQLPDCDTWREVYKPGDESVHFCVDKSDVEQSKTGMPWCDVDYEPPAVVPTRSLTLDDVHIDWKSPVVGVDLVTRTCEYDSFFNSADHWLQAKLGLGTPVFTFQVVEEQIDTLDTWVAQSFGTTVDADIRDFSKRWNAAKWDLAVQGKAGYDASMKYYEEGKVLLDRMSRERADPTKTPAY